MELMKLISNPVRVQVIQYLQTHGEATTKQIAEVLQDVPTPTLYRHINALLKEEVLLVKEERKVRGSLERLLVINVEKFVAAEQGNIADSAFQFLMGLYSRFQQYSNRPNADPVRDGLSLRTCILFLTDEKYMDFMHEIAAVISKYQQLEKEEHEKLRSVSWVSVPIEEDDK